MKNLYTDKSYISDTINVLEVTVDDLSKISVYNNDLAGDEIHDLEDHLKEIKRLFKSL